MAGSAVAGLSLVSLVVFVACFSASAFVENDLVDVVEDSRKEENRNPIAAGLISRKTAVAAFGLLAGASVAALLFLSPEAILLGLLALGLYWGYSWGLNLKAIPVVDVAVHGAVPAIFVLMGAELAGGVGYFASGVALVVFVYAAMSGLLQQLRDTDADGSSRRTTAMSLGASKTVLLCTGLALGGIALFASLPLAGLLPVWYLAFLPAAYFIVKPLVELKRSPEGVGKAIVRVRSAGLVISVLLVATYLVLA